MVGLFFCLYEIDVSHLVPVDEDAIIHHHATIHYTQFCHKMIQKLPNHYVGINSLWITKQDHQAGPKRIYNPITAMGFWQCLPFTCTTLRGKHCWYPIAVMGVVYTFEQLYLLRKDSMQNDKNYLCKFSP